MDSNIFGCCLFVFILRYHGTVGQGGSVTSSNGLPCLQASVCELTRYSINRAANASQYSSYLQAANVYANKYVVSKRCRMERTDKKCGVDYEKCWKFAQSDAILRLNLTRDLALACSGRVLPKMLLFCDPTSNGLEEWPQNIKDLLGNETRFKPCRHVDCQKSAYKAFHIANGKKYPEDFPKSWAT